MRALRGVLAFSLSFSLCFLALPLFAGGKPLGILMLAYNAQLNASEAFAGLSVFAGERMSTDAGGKAMVRIGASVVTLSEKSSATLEANGDGAHVDLVSGSVILSSTQKNPLEAHVEDALLRPHGEENMQCRVLMYAPKVLQVTTRVGSLDFPITGSSACCRRARRTASTWSRRQNRKGPRELAQAAAAGARRRQGCRRQ